MDNYSLICNIPELEPKAQALALRFNLPLNQEARYQLQLTEKQLQLNFPGFKPQAADFYWATWKKRFAEGKQQGIIKACQPKPGKVIVDATGGWGRDTAILASFGAKIILIERHPVVAALLADALERQSAEDQAKLHIELLFIEAKSWLSQLSSDSYPDLIYLDPMHPKRSKSALVKKDLQVLQDLIGPDEDALALLQVAKMRVKDKVVVKWPASEKALLEPSYSLPGKTIRYDIF